MIQPSSSSTPTGSVWGFPPATTQAFAAAYWASMPPAVQALQSLSAQPASGQQSSPLVLAAQALMQEGYLIDVDIMIFRWDPYSLMMERYNMGLSWVPSAGQQPGGGTGAVPPGAFPVPNMIQPLPQLLAFYPPAVPPAPVVPPSADAVGGSLAFEMSITLPSGIVTPLLGVNSAPAGENFPEGYVYTDPSGDNWLFHWMGTDLMGINQRYGVWLGPLPSPWPPAGNVVNGSASRDRS